MSYDNYDFKPGFCGHDSMRNKAMKEFGPEMRGLSLSTPESNSSKARTNMPLYKKGGRVHGLTKMQTDLYIPTRSKQHHQKQVRFEKVEHKADGGMLGAPDINSRIQQANQLLGGAAGAPMGIKHGGKVHHKHRVHKADGGMLGFNQMGNRDLAAGRSALGLRRGGKSHHKAHGGLMGSGKNQDDNRLMLRGEPLQEGFHGHGLRRGGKAHHNRVKKDIGGPLNNIGPIVNHGGIVHRKSEGGPMRGEMSGMGRHNNYESDMRGEHEVRGAMRHGGKARRTHRADGGPLIGALMNAAARQQANPMAGAMAQNPGGAMRHGGKVRRVHKLDGGSLMESFMAPATIPGKILGVKHGGKVHHKSEGGPMRGEHPTHHMSRNNYESNMRGEHGSHRKMNEGGKAFAEGGYAAGGVGKIRHGQMTMSGRQLLPRSKFKHG